MSAELHLARRYLVGLRRRTHVATVTLISMAGLGLGVLALVVTLALLEGFQSSIREEIVARAAHARVVPVDGRRLARRSGEVGLGFASRAPPSGDGAGSTWNVPRFVAHGCRSGICGRPV